MANNTITSTPLLGVSFDMKTTDPLMAPGTTVPLNSSITGRKGHFAMYIRANGVIGNSSYCTVDLSTTACYATSVASATSTGFFRNGSTAFADQEYGWVFVTKTALPQGDVPPNNANP